MSRLRWLVRCLDVVVVLSLALQPVILVGATATAPVAVQLQEAGRPQVTSLPPSALAEGPLSPERLLDTMVGQALMAAGLRVISQQSSLDKAGLQVSSGRYAGSGDWQVAAVARGEEVLQLGGTLTFEMTAAPAVDGAATVTQVVSGSLAGAGADLTLDISMSAQGDGDTLTASANAEVTLARDGTASTVRLSTTGGTTIIAHGLTRTVSSSTGDRDGIPFQATQTLTRRDFAHGESEVWIEVAASLGESQTSTSQHLYQRLRGGVTDQYLDRFDMQLGDRRYSLQAPVVMLTPASGIPEYVMSLVDEDGNVIKATSGPQPLASVPDGRGGPGFARATRSGSANDRWGSDTADGDSLPTLTFVTWETGQGQLHQSDPQPPQQSGFSRDDVRAAVGYGLAAGVGAIGLGAGAAYYGSTEAAAAAALGEEAAASGAIGQAAAAEAAAADAAAAQAFGGTSAAAGAGVSGVTSGAGAGYGWANRNGDPFFTYPDVRPSMDVQGQTPVEITRVTGGLVAPNEATGTPSSESEAAPAPYSYNDRPGAFVSGTLPLGALAIGDWQWGGAHSYGATPSHTHPAGDGPQVHYFTDASQPLAVTEEDNVVQYVFIDSDNPPRQVYLQFYTPDGNGEHRVYWGEDLVQTGGEAGTASLYPMGPLPQTGAWIRLAIPVDRLGLEGALTSGILYGTYGGQVWWGPTTTSSRLTDNAPAELAVEPPSPLPAMTPGTQVAFRLSEPSRLSIDIADSSGVVRTLVSDEDRPAGYQVVVWDGKDDTGADVADVPYRVRFSIGGQEVAAAGITISPLVASILMPGAYSIVRGNDVPVIGEAYGESFAGYTLEYGAGREPTEWTTIVARETPVYAPPSGESLRLFNPGNLANWDVGLSEFLPWNREGLNGLYTLRLSVSGGDGREAIDSVPVIVGRLAHFAEGGVITSSDGKANLTVPTLATENSFALMAIVPAAETDPGGAWQQSLPANAALAGEVYEILPADESFRRPVTLELPYASGSDPARLGVLLGDGTAEGWRYLGGTVDATKGTISVPVSEFGGRRALVAAFTADDFGAPQPYRSAPPAALEPAAPAPQVTASSAPYAFYSDMQSGAGEWQALDVYGTELSLATGEEAGLAEGDAALKVTRLAGGVRLLQARATPYDASRYPLLAFDYRAPADGAFDLLIRSNGAWWQMQIAGKGENSTAYFRTVPATPLVADDTWRHYQLDLLALLHQRQPNATSFQVDAIVLGQVRKQAFMQVVPIDGGAVGSAYYIDNLTAFAPLSAGELAFEWTPPADSPLGGYAYALDQARATVPTEAPVASDASVTLSLPPDAADGLWYLSLRGQDADGAWSDTAHFPVLIDRQPPQPGAADPPAGGVGSPDAISLAVTDASGIDLSSLRLQLGDITIAPGPALAYWPEAGSLSIAPHRIEPALPAIASGEAVSLSLTQLTDYAGNGLAEPYSWSFTADVPAASGTAFRRLTTDGGESPALSPDGTQVAFVSERSGDAKIWVMRADDLEEQSGSVRLLTTSSGHESDPAWSPDGGRLAYVSDAGGTEQIWTAAADGSDARALTAAQGAIASPTWSPDGRVIAFISDGNLWQVGADGSDPRPLTAYAEKPLRAVRWQPGGQLLAVSFKLYQETIELYDMQSGELTPLTQGGEETQPAWLNGNTLLYTAPSEQGGPPTIWQVNVDGSGAAILDGSGVAGVGDGEPAVNGLGNAVAIVSTRGGQRDVWIQGATQIAQFEVAPASTVTGQAVEVSYGLPAEATVTLDVLDADGATVRSLLSAEPQTRGAQRLTWDGLNAGGTALPAGSYTLKLSASAGEDGTLERYASVRLEEPSNIGTLQVLVNEWPDQLLADPDGLRVTVFPEGLRASPAAAVDGVANPAFQLPAGRYDVAVTVGDNRREVKGVSLAAGETNEQAVDLGLGQLQVTLLSAPDELLAGSPMVRVSGSDDPERRPTATRYGSVTTFVLAPGVYDVTAEVSGLRQTAYGVEVQPGLTSESEMTIASGVLQVEVLAYAGTPAEAGVSLLVQAFSPDDHDTYMASSYGNPASLRLAPGRYDVRVVYLVARGGTGWIERWVTGLEVEQDQTLAQQVDLRLGEASVAVYETAGRLAPAEGLTISIVAMDEPTKSLATFSLANTVDMQLPPGRYGVVADYLGTHLAQLGPRGDPFTVEEARTVTHTVDLGLGKLHVVVRDAAGQLADPSRVYARAFPESMPGFEFAWMYGANPLDLVLLGDTRYEVVVTLDDKELSLAGQTVAEGETATLEVSEADFQ